MSTYQWNGNNQQPGFDQELADSFVGQYLLFSVTYFDHLGKELEYEEFHGVIESASPKGVRIALRGKRNGEYRVLPPDLSPISAAVPGTYVLHSTGEAVEDPDLVASWSVYKPCKQ